MSAVERRFHERALVRVPLDSVAVVGRATTGFRAEIVAAAVAESVTVMLGRGARLRVPRADIVAPYGRSDWTVDEIGRALNVRGVAVCTVDAEREGFEVELELVDVLRDDLVHAQRFLGSGGDLLALEREVARAVAAHCEVDGAIAPHPLAAIGRSGYRALLEARVARVSGDAPRALAIVEEIAGSSEAAVIGTLIATEFGRAVLEGRLAGRVAEAHARLSGTCPHPNALQMRAELLIHFDRHWGAAEAVLRQAIEADPVSPGGHSLLADVLLATGRIEEAGRSRVLFAELMPADDAAKLAAAAHAYYGPTPMDAVEPLTVESHGRGRAAAEATEWLVRACIAGGDLLAARQHASTRLSHSLVAASAGEPFDADAFAPGEASLLFAAAGRSDAVAVSLHHAADRHDRAVLLAAVEPLFLPFASQPSFGDFLRRLRLR